MAKQLGTLKVKRIFLGVDSAGSTTEITASADELNQLDGSTVSAAELSSLSGAWTGDFTTAWVDGEDGTGVVTITLKTADGEAVSGVHSGIIYVADAATGAALSTITSLATATTGVITIVDTGAAKFYRFVTDVDGVFDATLTADDEEYFFIIVGPNNKVTASTVCEITTA